MTETHVITAVTDKRSELLGLIKHHQTHIQRLSINIDQLDATLVLFDPDYDFRKAKSKGIRVVNPWFKQGEVPRLLLEHLGKLEQPASTTQLTDYLIQLKGVGVAELKERDRLSKLVFGALKRMEVGQQIKCTGKIKGACGGVMLWVLV